MLDMWKKILDQGRHIFSVFKDLSRVFHTLNHDLSIAKSGAIYEKLFNEQKAKREGLIKLLVSWTG